MDVPGIPRPALVALIAVAVLLFAVGTSWALSWVTRQTDTTTRTLAAPSTIEVDASSGDVDVVGSDRRDMRLTTKESRTLFGRPHVHIESSAGRLRLDGKCSEFELWGTDGRCSVSYRLEVPRDATVHLVTRSGDVTVEDVRGAADLRTRSGDVQAFDVLGTLRLETISGDVHADSASADIDAGTTSGDVDVRAREATRVRAHTTSGDVHVRVPDRTYAVQTRAVSGDQNVDVRTDRNAPRSIDASTTSGDVHVSRDG
jgi:DUF4097 and DUF4098 domain-containing protein YvlB